MKTFLTGFGIGLVGALLLAPKRGNQMRSDLRRRANQLFDDLSSTLSGSKTDLGKKSPRSRTTDGSPRHTNSAVDILNSATKEALIAVHGIGPVLADRIIGNRPYETAYEIVEKGILPESTFVQLRRELLEKRA